MFYLLLALFVYVLFAIKNGKIIKTTIGNEIVLYTNKTEQKISWIAVFVLLFISGFRAYSVGCDVGAYKWCFDKIATTRNLYAGGSYFGIFYLILNWICSLFVTGEKAFTLLLLLLSVFNILTVVCVAKTISSDISITMFLFVSMDIFIPSFSMLRQSIAVSFVILAFKYLNNKKPLQYFSCIILGAMFHESVILLAALYFIREILFFKRIELIYVLFLAIFLVFVLFDEQIIIWVCETFNFHYYTLYSMIGEDMSLMANLKYIMFIAVFLFFWGYKIFCDKKGIKLNDKYQTCLTIYFIVALISVYNILSGKLLIISRMVYYFSWSIIFLVPMFLESIKNKKLKVLCTALVIVAGLLYLSTSVIIRDQFYVTPYKTIFEM